jgi:3-oxoacyl-[acyl-carrier protein] reductase
VSGRLDGSAIVVTGGAAGLGLAYARRFVREGACVFLADIVDPAEAVASLDAGDRAAGARVDVASAASVEEMVAAAQRRLGRIDVLVNNAGITRDGLAVRMKAADWDAVLDLNLGGTFRCIQQVLPGMMRNRWGRIVNITSVVGQAGSAGQANYAASKAGMIGLTKSLAQEMASRGITVNAVAPGYIDTDMTKDLPEQVKTSIMAAVPVGRMGTGEDVATAVRFLVSDEASYITGHVLAVNGGMYM